MYWAPPSLPSRVLRSCTGSWRKWWPLPGDLQLGVLDQGNILYLEKVDSPQAIRLISRVGDRLPANATALGKALLSGLSDEEVRTLYAAGLPRLTSHTVTELPQLLDQLAQIRSGALAR